MPLKHLSIYYQKWCKHCLFLSFTCGFVYTGFVIQLDTLYWFSAVFFSFLNCQLGPTHEPDCQSSCLSGQVWFPVAFSLWQCYIDLCSFFCIPFIFSFPFCLLFKPYISLNHHINPPTVVTWTLHFFPSYGLSSILSVNPLPVVMWISSFQFIILHISMLGSFLYVYVVE